MFLSIDGQLAIGPQTAAVASLINTVGFITVCMHNMYIEHSLDCLETSGEWVVVVTGG